jgi:predicted nucleic acid-binding protein
VIVLDTSVLSHVFRRPPERTEVSDVVARYINLVENQAPLVVPGIVFQEILSGVRDDVQFQRLRRAIEGFPLLLAEEADHLNAARLLNSLRRKGVIASTIDALIAATAMRREALLFTTDRDFEQIASLVPLKLLPK